jgi:hypothetical protein
MGEVTTAIKRLSENIDGRMTLTDLDTVGRIPLNLNLEERDTAGRWTSFIFTETETALQTRHQQ